MRALFSITVLAITLIANPARSAEAEHIAVVHELAADERAISRLRAELSTLGFEVVDVTLTPNEGATALDDAARRVNAFAAVHVVPGKGGVEVWIADGATGKTLFRELVIGPGEAFDDVVALKAVELLRASLAELGISAKRRGAIGPTRAVTRKPPALAEKSPELPRLFLELGPALAMSPGGIGATAHGFVGLSWRASTTLGVEAFAALPVTPASVSAPEGSADVRPSLFGLGVAAWLFDPRARWQIAGGVGFAVAHLGIEGSPTPPLLGRSDAATVALPFARFSVERVVTTRVRVGLHAIVGFAAPRPTIRFDEREVADWGRPLVLSTLGVAIALD